MGADFLLPNIPTARLKIGGPCWNWSPSKASGRREIKRSYCDGRVSAAEGLDRSCTRGENHQTSKEAFLQRERWALYCNIDGHRVRQGCSLAPPSHTWPYTLHARIHTFNPRQSSVSSQTLIFGVPRMVFHLTCQLKSQKSPVSSESSPYVGAGPRHWSETWDQVELAKTTEFTYLGELSTPG